MTSVGDTSEKLCYSVVSDGNGKDDAVALVIVLSTIISDCNSMVDLLFYFKYLPIKQ